MKTDKQWETMKNIPPYKFYNHFLIFSICFLGIFAGHLWEDFWRFPGNFLEVSMTFSQQILDISIFRKFRNISGNSPPADSLPPSLAPLPSPHEPPSPAIRYSTSTTRHTHFTQTSDATKGPSAQAACHLPAGAATSTATHHHGHTRRTFTVRLSSHRTTGIFLARLTLQTAELCALAEARLWVHQHAPPGAAILIVYDTNIADNLTRSIWRATTKKQLI